MPIKYKKKLDEIENYLMSAFKKNATYLVQEENGKNYILIKAKNERLFPVNPLKVEYSDFPEYFKEAMKRKSKKTYQRELLDTDLVCSFINVPFLILTFRF